MDVETNFNIAEKLLKREVLLGHTRESSEVENTEDESRI
jgi:hypothetical protein